MLEMNKGIEKDIKISIDLEVNNFKTVLSDEELKNYIVNLFEKYIYYFYKGYNDKISKQSLDLLNQSSIIKSVQKFIAYYKPKYEKIINSKLDDISKILIDKQAKVEKENDNMRVEFKRDIKKFKETTTVFFKRNYYYISQKYIIQQLIQEVFKSFIQCYRERLDNIVKHLLADKTNKSITINLQNCFLEKLKDFAKNNNVNIEIKPKNINESFNQGINNNSVNELPAERIRINSIDIINNFEIDKNEINDNNIEKNENPQRKQKWYPYVKSEKEWKYLNKKTALALIQFLEDNMIYQETYFKKINNCNDKDVLKMLKDYEKKDLINFFDNNFQAFMKNKICFNYNEKYALIKRNMISEIISNKIFEEIYIKKLNNIIDNINSDLDFCKIKYLTIVVIGRSGVGKSTLINTILKVDKAKTGFGDIVTRDNDLYNSEGIPFLKLYDTRGIELRSQYGPKIILENTLDIINKAEKQTDFNDYVNCIWYCVSNIYIDDTEIEIIRTLRKEKSNIPLIIVYSFAIYEEGFKNIHSKIKNEFPDALFIPVLAKPSDNNNSFGLDELLEKTIELCKKGLVKGKMYQTMRENLAKTILEMFKKEHKSLKTKVNSDITNNFINKFSGVLNEEQLLNYIYGLFESLFIDYLKINEVFDEKKIDGTIKNSLKHLIDKKFIENFINLYKNETKQLIDSIKNKKALDFIDKQVFFEKKNKVSINKVNKCDFNDFIKIIEDFLGDNFYYVFQKYIIYRIITEACEEISNKIEINENNLINNLVYNKSFDYLEKIFNKKFVNKIVDYRTAAITQASFP